MMNRHAPLYGLVLSGGKSTRMGLDKGAISYHGLPQREFLYDLLTQVCERSFLSVRADQAPGIQDRFEYLQDLNQFKGPFNGLLTAFQHFPDSAWLVLACDLPLMDLKAVEHLAKQRDSKKLATAYAHPENGLPEPLIAIWEPRGLEEAHQWLSREMGSCPRKFLMQAEIAILHPENPAVLLNANSPEDYEAVRHKLEANE